MICEKIERVYAAVIPLIDNAIANLLILKVIRFKKLL